MADNPEQIQAMSEAVAVAKDYADAVLKSPLQQFSGILSDTVGHWRMKNQVNLLLKARHFLKQKGVEPKKILPDIFVPLLEEGGSVGDETLSSMFASLLASHLDPTNRQIPHPSFAKVLAQFSSLDASLLLEARKYASYKEARDLGLRGSPISVESFARTLGVSEDDAYMSCLNLRRLGLFRHYGAKVPEGHDIPTVFEDDRDNQDFRITEYGISFCDACNR